MPDQLFRGLFDNALTTVISPKDFLLCIGSALILGTILSSFYLRTDRCSRSFLVTLALLPAVVCVVIMMVNGNVGTGVAVAGAFSLVRFRSAPGSAREITMLFLAMGAGLMTGMGYLGFAFLFTLLLGPLMLIYDRAARKLTADTGRFRTLSITIPEDLDYTDVFESLLSEYASAHELVRVKTTNMGSLFRLTYDLTLRDPAQEKELIDQLRCRNGNLEISISRQETSTGVL